MGVGWIRLCTKQILRQRQLYSFLSTLDINSGFRGKTELRVLVQLLPSCVTLVESLPSSSVLLVAKGRDFWFLSSGLALGGLRF